MTDSKKWVACWGNATSITNRREAVYAKDLTLRYRVIPSVCHLVAVCCVSVFLTSQVQSLSHSRRSLLGIHPSPSSGRRMYV